jgi:hypothetical protein
MAEKKKVISHPTDSVEGQIVDMFRGWWVSAFGDAKISSWEFLLECYDPADLYNALRDTAEVVAKSRKRKEAGLVFARLLVTQRQRSLKQWLADTIEYEEYEKSVAIVQ